MKNISADARHDERLTVASLKIIPDEGTRVLFGLGGLWTGDQTKGMAFESSKMVLMGGTVGKRRD